MGCFQADQPADRNYAVETAQTLDSQRRLMPTLWNAESTWQPKYQQLALGNLGISALGNASAGSGGMAGIYSQLLPMLTNAQSGASVNSTQNYGPAAVQALMNMDPSQAQLMDQLTKTTSNQLAAGTNLDPTQMRLVTQAARSGQAARGMGFGNADMYGEALGISQYGQDLLQKRISNAGSVAQLRQQIYGAPATQMVSSNQGGTAQNLLGMGQGLSGGPKLFSPESSYAGNIYNANQQMAAQFADPSTMSKIGQVGQGIGSIASMAAMFAM